MTEERKLVTVLFADVVGSTTMAAEHDAEVVRATLDSAFDRVAAVVRDHGGTVEKFIGDAVMAVFGVPAAHDDDAERALRAAAAIRDIVRTASTRIPLDVRIGVTTGEAVARTDTADQRLVTGVVVNSAQRLQAAAEPGEILVGEMTRQLTRGAVSYEQARQVTAKGLGEISASTVREVVDALPEQHRGIEGMKAPLIGRDSEVRLLTDAWVRVQRTGAPAIVTVYAPAGAGKSRLASEFIAQVGADRARVGRCLPYGDGITFYPLQAVLRRDAGIDSADDHAAAEAKLRAATLAAFAGDVDEAQTVIARLEALAGLSRSTTRGTDDLESAEELRWATRRYFERRAEGAPLLLVFEDLHWAEPALLDLLEHLAESSRGRIMLLCLARPEFREQRPAFAAAASNASAVTLSPLGPEETRRLVHELLAVDDLPGRVRDEVVDRAEGNPLYVEEFLRLLIDSGRVTQRDGRWVAAPDAVVDVPPTLIGLISARLDRLPADAKQVLQRASIAGRLFSLAALEAIGDAPVRPDLVRDAVRRDLIVETDERGIGGRAYRFKHVLIRDVVYGAIPKATRARMHDRYGRWIEAASGDRSEEIREIVAHHAERAFTLAHELADPIAGTLAPRALDLLFAAGDAAASRMDDRGALAHYQRAASVADRASAPAAVSIRAQTLALMKEAGMGLNADVRARAAQLLETAESEGPSPSVVLLLTLVGTFRHEDEVVDRALDMARRLGARPELARALRHRSDLARRRREVDRADRLQEEALQLALDIGDVGLTQLTLRGIVIAAINEGRFTRALAALEQRQAYVGDRPSKQFASSQLRWRSVFLWAIGDLAAAEPLAIEAQRVVEETGGLTHWIANFRTTLAARLTETGRQAQALSEYIEAADVFERLGDEQSAGTARVLAASVAADVGSLGAAEALASSALQLRRSRFVMAKAEITRAKLLAARGDTACDAAFTGALEIALGRPLDGLDDPPIYPLEVALLRWDHARSLLSRGRHTEAVAPLRALREFYADPLAFRRAAQVDALLAKCEGVASAR